MSATLYLDEWLVWVIRVDMAMSALSSAIDGTGHYHVQPRPVFLWPSCVRSANNGHNSRSSGVPTSVDLAHMTHVRPQRVGIAAAMGLHGNCCLGALPGFRQIAIFAKDSAGARNGMPRAMRYAPEARSCSASGSASISPTVMRGLSDAVTVT